MFNNKLIVRKIDNHFVQKSCVQIMYPYYSDITILSNDGFLYHNSSDGNINHYLDDYRKRKFPYSSIPVHYGFSPLHGRVTYVNQLFDYNKSYFVFTNKTITENIILKRDDSVYHVSEISKPHIIDMDADGITFEDMLKSFVEFDDNVYYLSSMGNFLSIYSDTNLKIDTFYNIIQKYGEIIWKISFKYNYLFIEGIRISKDNHAYFYRIDEKLKSIDEKVLLKAIEPLIPNIKPLYNPEISIDKINRENQKIKKIN